MAKHYTNPAPKPRAVIGTPWWIRLAVYVVVAAVGLALVAFGIASPEQVDSWLGQTGGLAALIGGALAAVNTGRESDEAPVGVVIEQPATPEPEDAPTLPVYTGPTTAGE